MILILLIYILPDADEDFSAEVVLDGFVASHDSLRGGDEDDTAARLDLRNLRGAGINTTTRLRNLFDFVDGRELALFVDDNVEGVARGVVEDFVVSEIASLLKRLDNGNFELGGWEINLTFANHRSVANTS